MYGLSFVLLAAICETFRRIDRRMPWVWLGLFGLVHGLNEWLDMLAMSLGDSEAFKWIRLSIAAVSFIFLFEFGRRAIVRDGRPILGVWFIVPFLAMAGVGAISESMNGFNAVCRYFLALPGGLMTGIALLRFCRQFGRNERIGLWCGGIAFIVYAFAAGVVVPKTGFWPASWLNHDSFFASTEFPVQLLRAMCAVTAMMGMWLYSRGLPGRTNHTTIVHRWFCPTVVVLMIGLGWFMTERRGGCADADLREHQITHAVRIAGTINSERVKELSFTSADRDNPVYERIREQMITYGRYIHQRCIYSMAIREDKIVFGPESLDVNDPLASPPGTVYEQPGEADWNIFRIGRPVTVGPVTDEYGTFISAMAPVTDPHTGKVLMVIGLDIPVEEWQAYIASHRLIPIVFTLLPLLVFLGGITAISRRSCLPWERQIRLRHLETVLAGICGLLLTGGAIVFAAESESHERDAMFERLATSRSEKIRDQFLLLWGDLAAVGRFYEGSHNVEREEFHQFSFPIIESLAVQAIEWVPRVPRAEKDKIEAEAVGDGLSDFSIWERNTEKQKIPAAVRNTYYPVYYVEPVSGNESSLGFDLGSEPVRRGAIEKASRTGLITASESVTLVQEKGKQHGVLIFQPVFANDANGKVVKKDESQLRGFAVGAIRMQTMLATILSHNLHENEVAVSLIDLTSSDKPILLAEYPQRQNKNQANIFKNDPEAPDAFQNVYPLFFYGRSYAIIVNPRAPFYADSLNIELLAIVSGLFLTSVMTSFVWFLRNRQTNLEGQIRQHTIELRLANEQLQTIIDRMPVGVIIVGQDKIIRKVNDFAVKMMKCGSSNEVTGKRCHKTICPSETGKCPIIDMGKTVDTSDKYLLDCHGNSIPILKTVTPLMLNGEKVLLEAFVDITQIKEAQAQLVKEKLKADEMAAQAEKANAAKSEFLAHMSHELRTPLHAIISFAGFGTKKYSVASPEKLQDYFLKIQQSGKTLLSMVNDLLDLSKIEAGKMKFEFGAADMCGLVSQVIDEVYPLMSERNITVEWNAPSVNVPVVIDGEKIKQVVRNLMSNAVKFASSGTAITVDIKFDADRFRFSIHNQGQGIPENEIESIFDKFVQSSVTQVGVGGTGLGLAICRQIVEAHGGRIWGENDADGGARFSFTIPFLKATELNDNNQIFHHISNN